jgi:hypothetical protein
VRGGTEPERRSLDVVQPFDARQGHRRGEDADQAGAGRHVGAVQGCGYRPQPELSDFRDSVKALRETLAGSSPSKDEIKQDVDNIKVSWAALKDKVSKVKTDCKV